MLNYPDFFVYIEQSEGSSKIGTQVLTVSFTVDVFALHCGLKTNLRCKWQLHQKWIGDAMLMLMIGNANDK